MRLWQSLERVQGWAGVRSVWREHMGDELQFLQPLLRPMEELAMSVPWPGTVEGRKVVVHDEDDIVAVDPETCESAPIRREDIVLWQLDADRLFAGVASALGLEGKPSSVGMGNRLWWLGDYLPVEGERFPVYLATTRDAQSLLRSAGHISALSQRPFVLVTPTRAGASEELNRVVEGRSSAWITLAESLTWQGEDVFEPNAQATRLANHTTTLAVEFARQGRDWEQELRQRAKELALMNELGLALATAPAAAPAPNAPAENTDPADTVDEETASAN